MGAQKPSAISRLNTTPQVDDHISDHNVDRDAIRDHADRIDDHTTKLNKIPLADNDIKNNGVQFLRTDDEGVLSWSTGPKGDTGAKGEKGDPGQDGADGADGADGKITNVKKGDNTYSRANIRFTGASFTVTDDENNDEIEVAVNLNQSGTELDTTGASFGDVLTFLSPGITWAPPETGTALPDQTNNSGKFLTTNGSTLSWATPTGTSPVFGNVTLNTFGQVACSPIGNGGLFIALENKDNATKGDILQVGTGSSRVPFFYLGDDIYNSFVDPVGYFASMGTAAMSVTAPNTGGGFVADYWAYASSTQIFEYYNNAWVSAAYTLSSSQGPLVMRCTSTSYVFSHGISSSSSYMYRRAKNSDPAVSTLFYPGVGEVKSIFAYNDDLYYVFSNNRLYKMNAGFTAGSETSSYNTVVGTDGFIAGAQLSNGVVYLHGTAKLVKFNPADGTTTLVWGSIPAWVLGVDATATIGDIGVVNDDLLLFSWNLNNSVVMFATYQPSTGYWGLVQLFRNVTTHSVNRGVGNLNRLRPSALSDGSVIFPVLRTTIMVSANHYDYVWVRVPAPVAP